MNKTDRDPKLRLTFNFSADGASVALFFVAGDEEDQTQKKMRGHQT